MRTVVVNYTPKSSDYLGTHRMKGKILTQKVEQLEDYVEKYARSGLGAVAVAFCPNDPVCPNPNPSRIFIEIDNLIPKIHVTRRALRIAQVPRRELGFVHPAFQMHCGDQASAV